MKTATILMLASAGTIICACDLFLNDIGGLGEPCSEKNQSCYADLICIDDVCTKPAGLGESCDQGLVNEVDGEEYEKEYISDCADELWCVEGTCVRAGDEGEACRLVHFGSWWAEVFDIQACNGDLVCYCNEGFYDDCESPRCEDIDKIAGEGDDCVCVEMGYYYTECDSTNDDYPQCGEGLFCGTDLICH